MIESVWIYGTALLEKYDIKKERTSAFECNARNIGINSIVTSEVALHRTGTSASGELRGFV